MEASKCQRVLEEMRNSSKEIFFLQTMKPLAVTETQVIVLSNHLKGKTLFWMDLTAPDKIPLQNVP